VDAPASHCETGRSLAAEVTIRCEVTRHVEVTESGATVSGIRVSFWRLLGRVVSAVADPAIVSILCSPEQYPHLKEIPNLTVQVRPMYTGDPDVVEVTALADDSAQHAAIALGCRVTVVVTADDYRKRVEALYEDPSEPGPVA
jgi:hypothetical protein